MRQRDKQAIKRGAAAAIGEWLRRTGSWLDGAYWSAQPHRCGKWRTGYCDDCDPDLALHAHPNNGGRP